MAGCISSHHGAHHQAQVALSLRNHLERDILPLPPPASASLHSSCVDDEVAVEVEEEEEDAIVTCQGAPT